MLGVLGMACISSSHRKYSVYRLSKNHVHLRGGCLTTWLECKSESSNWSFLRAGDRLLSFKQLGSLDLVLQVPSHSLDEGESSARQGNDQRVTPVPPCSARHYLRLEWEVTGGAICHKKGKRDALKRPSLMLAR